MSVIQVDPIALLEDHQEGCCAVCGEARRRLLIDHDHESGLIRGLLCNGCNTSEGRDYRAPWFQRYRNDTPSAQLGLRIPYGRRPKVNVELVPTMKALSDQILKAGWHPGTLWWVTGGIAFDIRDALGGRVVGQVRLWTEGQHRGFFTWSSTSLTVEPSGSNPRQRLSAATSLDLVTDAVVHMLEVRKIARLLAIRHVPRDAVLKWMSSTTDLAIAAFTAVASLPRSLQLAGLSLLVMFVVSFAPTRDLLELASSTYNSSGLPVLLYAQTLLALLVMSERRISGRPVSAGPWTNLAVSSSVLGLAKYYMAIQSMPMVTAILAGLVPVGLTTIAVLGVLNNCKRLRRPQSRPKPNI